MLLKCNCTNCSTPLEFESENVGTVISCPACGLPTKLQMPEMQPTPPRQSTTPRDSAPSPDSPAGTLKAVRARTCYPLLRTFAKVIQIIGFVAAALIIVVTIVGAVGLFNVTGGMSYGIGFVPNAMLLIFGFLYAGLIVFVSIVVKHALLLVVDIADCQIQKLQKLDRQD